MITYRIPPAIVYVSFNGSHVGSIRHNEHTDTWSYRAQKSTTRGDEFSTLAECKTDLEQTLNG